MYKMKVILFKSTPEDVVTHADKFHTALISTDLNLSPEIVPVIKFSFCNLEILKRKLESHENYGGIILSSPRCVSSVEKAINCSFANASSLLQLWGSCKRIFCVGRSTAEYAAKLFINSCNISTSPNENAESLAHHIVEVLTLVSLQNTAQGQSPGGLAASSKPLLYPCGNLKTDTISNILCSGNVESDIIVVYETVENPELEYLVSNLCVQENSPFVFFSPSGLNYALRYGKDLILVKNRPLIALGPTTLDTLLKVDGLNPEMVFQCKTPSPEGLMDCLKLIISKSCTN